MSLNYNSINIHEGGNKLRFNTNIVDKLYFGNELMYQNTLAVGTVLLSNYKIDTGGGVEYDIELPKVVPDWSNVNSNLKFSVSFNGIGAKDVITTVSKEKLLFAITIGHNFGTVMRDSNSNLIHLKASSYNWTIDYIKLV